MAAISSKGNKTTELKMLDLLRTNRIAGWRRQIPLTGRSDFGFPDEKLAVFIDGSAGTTARAATCARNQTPVLAVQG
jgi:hypothetical protein